MNKCKNTAAVLSLVFVLAGSSVALTPRSAAAAEDVASTGFAELITRIQELVELVEELTRLVQQQSVAPEPEPKPVMPVSGKYSLTDVVTVSATAYGSCAADAGHTLYTVTLRDDTERSFKVYCMSSDEMTRGYVLGTGYQGDVDALLALAKKDEPVSPLPAGDSVEIMDIDINGQTVALTFAASREGDKATACGPIFFAQVHWNDGGVAEDVYGLGCSAGRQKLTAVHVYENPGKYAIFITDKAGHEARTELTIGDDIEYTVTDVLKVTTEAIDPIPMAIDDEHTVYTMYLTDGTAREVAVYGMSTWEMVEESFSSTGFVGDVRALMDMAN